MNINLVYVVPGHIEGAPGHEMYRPGARRFVETYLKFPPGHPHRLMIVNANGGMDSDSRLLFEGVATSIIETDSTGWDIGQQQQAATKMEPDDWGFFMSSWAHFTQADWLPKIVEAIEAHGDCLYGTQASRENNLHIRGSGYCCRAGSFNEYPHLVTSRAASFRWESGDGSFDNLSFTNFHLQRKGAWLVTPTGCYPKEEWKRPNGFRCGDGSEILVADKHSEIYLNASAEERAGLHARTWG